MLNEISEKLPLRSNFLGAIREKDFKAIDQKCPLKASMLIPFSELESPSVHSGPLFAVCEYFPEEKVAPAVVMGRHVWDQSIWRKQAFPKMLPFEFLCHFTLTESSLQTLRVDAVSIPKSASLHTLQPGVSWDFPLVELVLPHDPLKRRIGLSEALWISGLSPQKLQELILSAAWLAAWTRAQARAATLVLESVQLRFAIDEREEAVLVDAFSLDDLGFEKEGTRFQLETALEFYQKTTWYDSVFRAKKQAAQLGLSEWRRSCVEPAPMLDSRVKARIEEEHRTLLKLFMESPGHV
jgi:hypothetical protein